MLEFVVCSGSNNITEQQHINAKKDVVLAY